jgi:hypothetical protein
VAGPGELIGRVGEDRVDADSAEDGCGDEDGVGVEADGGVGGLMGVGDGGGERPGSEVWRETAETGEGEFGLGAAFAGEQFVPFVEYDGAQGGESFGCVLAREEESERLGGGHEDVREEVSLALALGGGGVAGAALDACREGEIVDGLLKGEGDIAGDRAERCDVEGVDAGGRFGLAKEVGEVGEGTPEGGVGLSGAGGDLDQAAAAGGEVGPGVELELVWLPAFGSEPGGDQAIARGG